MLHNPRGKVTLSSPFIEIEGDDLQNEIAELVVFASSTPIPRNYTVSFTTPASTMTSDESIPMDIQ